MAAIHELVQFEADPNKNPDLAFQNVFNLILDQARLNYKELLGLAGGLRSTECHSSILDN